MDSVLQKTMQSLEAALRYNPTSVELMASLAEVYIRLGRFDKQTMDLCEAVLRQQSDNLLLRQAQSIGLLIEQSRLIEESLQKGEAPPPLDAVESSIDTLSEFLGRSEDCLEAWIAWTRFQILAGHLDTAVKGVAALQRQGAKGLDETLQQSLLYSARRTDLAAEQYRHLADLYARMGAPTRAIRLMEKLFDEGHSAVGPALREFYLKRYVPSRAEEVPEAIRERLFAVLLAGAEREVASAWLRKAILLGWEVKGFARAYAGALLGDGQLDEAYAILQRVPMDLEVKELLNQISEQMERMDEIDKAVAVLRFINDHELIEEEHLLNKESDLVRDADVSMADLHLKSGRYSEALQKYVSALCQAPQVDLLVLDRIDEILEAGQPIEFDPLIRLGQYFHRQGDQPKAIFYLNQGLERDPGNKELLQELEIIFNQILSKNPELHHLNMELGQLYLRQGKFERAIDMFTAASAAPTLALEANRFLAKVFVKTGQISEALEKYRNQRIEEEDLGDLYELHEIFIRRQLYREALMALDLIAKADASYRGVMDKIRLLEDRIGKLQPEIVADPKMRELIGDLAVGRYQYLDRLGSGGMGVVHKVFDIRNQQVVAMKILRDSLSGSSKALDRFFREARIAATIRHRNIVNIYDYNISNLSGQSYIVMEYVDGPSLRELIDRQFQNTISVPLDYITEILYYCVQLCDALGAAHGKGIVHRDIKPDNIMITTLGEVKITDFGIVHVEEATFTPTGAMLGTPRYMSPEQVTGGKIDGRSDIYSVGIMLYETLVGSPPFMSGDVAYQQVHNPPVPPREINPIIPQGCAEMILKCLGKRPEDRYLNAHALKDDVLRQLENLGGCAKFNNKTFVDAPQLIELEQELDLG